ncbi:MAG: lipocalin family protein [Syntrophobacterales bacterium]|nr:lipocalin family protein [Syntrophobacterales bacterium]
MRNGRQAGLAALPVRNRAAALVAAVLCAALCACAGPGAFDPSKAPPTVARVELARYQGTWYEIARLPMWFQRNCLRSQATYGLLETGEVSVLNECDTAGGGRRSVTGRARSVDAGANARLEVRFDNGFSVFIPPQPRGNYWVLYLDEDYRTVIVGTPDRENLWIMARTPAIDEARYAELVEIARKLGFDTTKLVRRK